MATSPSRYRIWLVATAVLGLISSGGCAALDPMGTWLTGGGGTVRTPPAATFSPPDSLPTPGFDVFRVVAWGLAIVLGSLVLAFVAKLLNGRGPNPLARPNPASRTPEAAPTRETRES